MVAPSSSNGPVREPGSSPALSSAAAPGLCSTNVLAPHRWQVALLLLLFIGIAIYGSLVPFKYRPLSLAAAWEKFQHIPLLKLGMDSRADWVANLLLFIPLGFLGMAVLRMDQRRSWLWSLGCFVLLVPLLCVASMGLEFWQLWYPNRTVSQNDIFAETIGGAVGAGLWLMFGQRWLAMVRRWLALLDPGHRIDAVLFIVLVAHVISSALPLDLTIHPRELWQKYKLHRFQLIPGQSFRHMQREEVFEMAWLVTMNALVGWLAARVFFRRQRKRLGIVRLLLGGLLFGFAIEFMQIFVFSRNFDVDDILLAAVGFTFGGWLLPVRRDVVPAPPSPFQWGLRCGLWLAYLAGLLIFFWYPFQFTFNKTVLNTRAANFFHTPFASLYVGSDHHAMQEIIRKTALFALLVLLTGWAWQFDVAQGWGRRVKLFAVLAFSWLIAGMVEVVQIAQPDHVAEVTDVLLYLVGSGGGAWLLTYLFPPSPHFARRVVK